MAIVKTTPQADDDLLDIWEYIAQDSVEQADRFIDKIKAAFSRLADMPLGARQRPELRANLRSRPFGKYVIFYEPLPDGILVVAVLWGGRDIEAIFKKD